MKRRKGASIVLILIMVMLLSILGTQVLVTLNSEAKANMNMADSTQAAYVAQAMAESFAVYIKGQDQESFLKLYKLAKDKNLVIPENAALSRVSEDKLYSEINVTADDLKKITESGNEVVSGDDFKDFKAEGIIKFYDLSEANPEIPKNADPATIDPTKIKKVKVRAEGWFNRGTKENPDYTARGIDLYFNYDIENNKIYGDEPATIIVKKNLSLNKRIKLIETEKDLDTESVTGRVLRIKHPLGLGVNEKIAKMEQDLGLGAGQIKIVNKDNDYYNFKLPSVTDFFEKRNQLITQGKDIVKIGDKDINTQDKTIVNKIAEYFDSTRGIIWNLKKAREVSGDEKNINGTLFNGTYYGGSKLLKTKPAYSINGEGKGLTSGVYHKLRSKNNAMSSYHFNIANPNNYFSSRSIVIDTEEGKTTEIVLDELDIQAPIFVRGKGLVHFYVKDSVRIGNLSTLYTESFIFENPISDMNTDTEMTENEIVDATGSNSIHFKNNISRVTIFYSGTDPVVLSGTIENSVNVVAPNASIVLSPTVGQWIFGKNKNMTFKGVLISGQDIDINLGKVGLTVGSSFKYRMKGLFYAPYGNISIDAKKPVAIAGTMIAENISIKSVDAVSYKQYIGLKTGYEYSYKELEDRKINLKGSKFFLAFMKNI